MHLPISIFCFYASIVSSINLIASDLMSLQNALLQSKLEQKNIFVQYESDWCDQCSFMNDSILTNPYIQSVIHDEYIGVVANISHPETMDWFEQFKVTCTPTIQIIDMNGNILVERHDASEEELYSHLLDHTITRELITGMIETKPTEFITNDVKEKSVTPTTIRESIKEVEVSTSEGSPGEILDITQYQYTVTIGAFSIRQNAEKFLQSITNQNLVSEVFIEVHDEKELYRVNAGRFPSPQSCQSVIKALHEKNISCYMRKLSSID